MRQTRIDYRAAGQGNRYANQQALESLDARIGALELKTGSSSFDPENQTPLAAVPPRASISFSAVARSGHFVVRITNPEYVGRGNVRKTPLLHHLEFSPMADFSSGVVGFPVSTQTYYSIPVEDVGGTPGEALTGYVQVKSSADGQNFNLPQRSQKLTA